LISNPNSTEPAGPSLEKNPDGGVVQGLSYSGKTRGKGQSGAMMSPKKKLWDEKTPHPFATSSRLKRGKATQKKQSVWGEISGQGLRETEN